MQINIIYYYIYKSTVVLCNVSKYSQTCWISDFVELIDIHNFNNNIKDKSFRIKRDAKKKKSVIQNLNSNIVYLN